MIDIKQYLEETNTVLLTKESFEYLKERTRQRWTPCSERLPEEEGQYLVTLDFSWGKEIEMGDWFNGEWVNPNSHVTVAWMELPTPWKESEVQDADSN